MLQNLNVLTNEEGVLTALRHLAAAQVSKITNILICRDPLTQTSRGICYLEFDNLVDSMSTQNALLDLYPPLTIDGRVVTISYCNDTLGDVPQLEDSKLHVKVASQHNQQPNNMQQFGCETAKSATAIGIQRQKQKLNSIKATADYKARAASAPSTTAAANDVASTSTEISRRNDGKKCGEFIFCIFVNNFVIVLSVCLLYLKHFKLDCKACLHRVVCNTMYGFFS